MWRTPTHVSAFVREITFYWAVSAYVLRNNQNFSRRWIFIVHQRNFIKEKKDSRDIAQYIVLVIIISDLSIFFKENECDLINFVNFVNKLCYKVSPSRKEIYLAGVVRFCFLRCFMRSIHRVTKRNVTPWIYSTSRSCIPWFYAWLWHSPSYIGRGILQERLCLAVNPRNVTGSKFYKGSRNLYLSVFWAYRTTRWSELRKLYFKPRWGLPKAQLNLGCPFLSVRQDHSIFSTLGVVSIAKA